MTRNAWIAAIALCVLPAATHAQSVMGHPWSQRPEPGLYFGVQGGPSWLFDTTIMGTSVSPQIGYAVGGMIGYDFVGVRIEVEGVYRNNRHGGSFAGRATQNQVGQLGILANVLYDFDPGATITPYIGGGLGVGFVDGDSSLGSTQFAYQGIIGLGWNVQFEEKAENDVRIGLEGRYYGTSNPGVGGATWSNGNVAVMASLKLKLGTWHTRYGFFIDPPRPPPSFFVFFGWDSIILSPQGLTTVKLAADTYRSYGTSTRIGLTGHTDKSGPSSYNNSLSLRRANAVKDALVRQGVPAEAIVVVGKGDTELLVPADGREPQNRRVLILIQRD